MEQGATKFNYPWSDAMQPLALREAGKFAGRGNKKPRPALPTPFVWI
jgi:hypothetical protein